MRSYRFIIILFLSSIPAISFGQETATATATSSDGGFFEAVLDRVQTFGNETSDTPSSSEASPLEKRTQERLTNLAANISNRLEGLGDRLRNISLRLERRIKKLEAEGYSVTAAQGSLTAANAALTEARDSLATIDRDVYQALRSPDPLTEWKSVRRTYIEARDSLRLSHTYLRETVANLKAAAPLPPPEAATTTDPNVE